MSYAELTMKVTPEIMAKLKDMAKRSGVSLTVLCRRAFAFYEEALLHHEAGGRIFFQLGDDDPRVVEPVWDDRKRGERP